MRNILCSNNGQISHYVRIVCKSKNSTERRKVCFKNSTENYGKITLLMRLTNIMCNPA